MKTTTIAFSIATLAAAAALGTYITREHKTSTASVEAQAQPPAEMQAAASNQNSAAEPVTPGSHTTSSVARQIPGAARAEVAATRDPGSVIFDQAVRTLISSQTSFQEKQAAWGQIRSAGKFDQLISDLEQRFAAQPTAPELPATLGQAYLQKAGSIQDIREQGILGMKADQSFDAALNLDASNWEARYWKAMAMSYW